MKISLLFTGMFLLASTPALANPIPTFQEGRGAVFAGPHVKLSYTANWGPKPVGAPLYGTSHSKWVQTGTTSHTTSSGYQKLPILEMCDCHVPSGTTLKYTLVYNSLPLSDITVRVKVPTVPSSSVGCETECQEADAKQAAAAGKDAGPAATDVPDTVEAGGCSFHGLARASTLPFLALLGIAIAALRRRS